ncbi:MAG: GNVR domain-containing protein, partial [Bacteroidota bacterium]
EAKNKTLDQKIRFIDEQIEATEEKIQEFEGYFEDFTIDNMTVSLEGDIAKTIVELGRLDSQQFNLEERIRQIRAIDEQINTDRRLILDAYTLTLLPEFLREALQQYSQELDLKEEKLGSYNENTQVVQRINLRLESVRVDLEGMIGRYKQALDESLKKLKSRRGALERNFSELPSMGTEYNKNRRLYGLQEAFLQNLRQSKMQLELTKAGTVTDGVLLSPASSPSTAISPKKLLIMGAGIAAAFVLSFLFIVVRYLLNNEITGIKELENLTSVPIIGTVPLLYIHRFEKCLINMYSLHAQLGLAQKPCVL